MRYISFGEYNKYYKYIIFSCIFNCLSYYIFYGNLNQDLFSLNVISINAQSLYQHFAINDCFNYIGIFIISFILYKLKGKNIDSPSEITLFNKYYIRSKKKKYVSFLNLSFILSFWITINHIIFIVKPLTILDNWIFELLFLCLMYSKLFKIKIYNHQKIGIIINSLSYLLFRIIIFIILQEQNNYKSYDLNILYKWIIPISIFSFLFITCSKSYLYIKFKFYMEIEFFSPIKLLIICGILGFFMSSIACLIETSFKCIGGAKELLCQIPELNNKNDKYIDNFFIFIKKFSSLKSKDIAIEILIIFVGMIINFCAKYIGILIIYYLTPIHFIFSNLCGTFLSECIELIRSIIKKGNTIEKNIYKKEFLRIPIYICSFIGFMIYLEKIELNFCNLNYNLRKHIMERANIDSIRYEDCDCECDLGDCVEIEGYRKILNENDNNIELFINKDI